jgi:hypothetical protein
MSKTMKNNGKFSNGNGSWIGGATQSILKHGYPGEGSFRTHKRTPMEPGEQLISCTQFLSGGLNF